MTDVWKRRWRNFAFYAAGLVLAFAGGLAALAGVRRKKPGQLGNGSADPISQAQARIAETRAKIKEESDQALADLFNKNAKGTP